MSIDCFSSDYSQARRRFRETAVKLDWQLESLVIEGRTPGGEELTVDVAVSSQEPGDQTVVLSSGLHGVEGFFGSAVQLDWLAQWRRVPPPSGLRIVMLHALNPYGFAWIRRADEANRDLNRNFVLEGEVRAGAPALYAQLDSLLNPKGSPTVWRPLLPKLLVYILRFGYAPLQAAVASGQYEFPQGLFFGGKEASQINCHLSRRLPQWLAGSRRVLHFDLHTGLGRYGQPTLLLDTPLSQRHRHEFDRWFGAEAYRELHEKRAYYQAQGSFGRWCCANSNVADYVYACVECGTHMPLRVLSALRDENQSYHWTAPDSVAGARAKKKLLEAFCPASAAWRGQVLSKARELTSNAIGGLLEAH